jgi:large subunit ribosomal protein L5
MANDNDAKSGDAKPAKKAPPKGAANKGQKRAKAAPKSDAPPPIYKREKAPRLKTTYDTEVRAKLTEEFAYKNPMMVPRLVKITLNMGLGAALANPKVMDSAVEEMRLITGQGPVVTIAKKDIANFKLRTGQKIGCMLTLRRQRMWEFLDRLISVALPRVRDFKGVSDKAFDGRGNYSLGVREQIIFPEIDFDSIDSIKGLNITIVTTAKSDDEARALLRHLGMPFRKSAAASAAA